MTQPQVGPTARWWDDFAMDQEFVTQGRTITEVECTLWSMFSGDMNSLHVDEEFARAHGLFNGRFPPGLMTVGIASGLHERLGLFAGTGLAMRDQSIRYVRPVLIGDTIHEVLQVIGLAAHPTKPRGDVTFGYRIMRRDELCIEGEWTVVVSRRAETAHAATTAGAAT